MNSRYKETGTNHLFGEEFRLQKINKHSDPLERFNNAINWELFLSTLQELEKKSIRIMQGLSHIRHC
jgi:hypothetical protein